MAIVRCKQHGRPKGRTQRYVTSVRPVGYPDTAAICGREGCTRPGLVWLTDRERAAYQRRRRVFSIPSAAAKIKVE